MHDNREPAGALPVILRLLSYAALSWLPLPLIAVCVGMSDRTHTDAFFLACVGLCTVCGWLGALISALLHAEGNRVYPVFHVIGLFLGGCLTTAGAFALSRMAFDIVFSVEPQLTFAVPASALCAYILCALRQKLRFFEIISFNIVRAMVIILLAAFLILRANGIVLPFIPAFSVLIILTLLIYWTAQNQRNIDFMMERREHDVRHLPAKIRSFNLRILAAFFVLALLSLLLSGPIMGVLGILGGFLQKAMINCAGTGGEEMEPTPQPTQGSDPGDSLPPADSNFALFWAILVLVILFIFYAPLIWRGLRGGMQRLMRALVALLRRLHKPKHRAQDANEEYSDIVEILPSGETNDMIEPPQAGKLKLWKKKVKRFRKMPEGEEKYRFGYSLILEGMVLRNLPLLPSDTPLEAAEKIRSRLVTVPQMEAATQCYDAIRYALDTRDTDSSQLNSILHVLETMRPLPEAYKPRLS